MTLAPLPERELFEREIHDLINGDMSEVARLLRFDYSTVSRAFNPFKPERHNPVYLFLMYLWAFDYLRGDLGTTILQIVVREREKWLIDVPVIAEHPAELNTKIGKEFFEALEAEAKGMDVDDQIREFSEARNLLTAKINNLIAKRAVEKYRREPSNVREIETRRAS